MPLDTLFGNKADHAKDLLRAMEPPEGYWLAFSGGKDSITIHRLAVEAGVRFVAHYNQSMEPPEVVHFIEREYPEVVIHRPRPSMWALIKKNNFPPTRLVKYCCGELKEKHGEGLVVTGIRSEESSTRRARRQVEVCRNRIGKRFLHPILGWTAEEVWEFIRSRGLKYPSLYDEGRDRIGCVLCPMGDTKQMTADAKRWPRIAKAYARIFDDVIAARKEKGMRCDWENGEALLRWWIGEEEGGDDDDQTLPLFE